MQTLCIKRWHILKFPVVIWLGHYKSAFKYFWKRFKEEWFHILYSYLLPKFLSDTCYSFVWNATRDNVIKPTKVCVAVKAEPMGGDVATLQSCKPMDNSNVLNGFMISFVLNDF